MTPELAEVIGEHTEARSCTSVAADREFRIAKSDIAPTGVSLREQNNCHKFLIKVYETPVLSYPQISLSVFPLPSAQRSQLPSL